MFRVARVLSGLLMLALVSLALGTPGALQAADCAACNSCTKACHDAATSCSTNCREIKDYKTRQQCFDACPKSYECVRGCPCGGCAGGAR
jgi:hypothetical protein